MTHHSHVSHHRERPKTTESEADNYDEDDFEEASYDSEDNANSNSKSSPAKPSVEGLNLESYMDLTQKSKPEVLSPSEKDLTAINIETSITALEGVYPKTGDKDQILKRLNLGYTEAVTPKSKLNHYVVA